MREKLIPPNEDEPSVVSVVMVGSPSFAEERSGIGSIGIGLISGFVGRSRNERSVSSDDVSRSAGSGGMDPASLAAAGSSTVVSAATA